MGYSNYSEMIVNDERYRERCEKLLARASDEEVKRKMSGILYEGGFDNFSVNSQMGERDNPDMEKERRLWTSYILATNPQAFYAMEQNNAILFHGTNANALPSILTHGIQSVADAQENNLSVVTGEVNHKNAIRRRFISFTNSLSTALNYTSLAPTKDSDSELSFGVLIGIDPEDVKKLNYTTEIASDVSEIGILDTIPPEYIKFLGVPEDKVEFVQKLVGDRDIQVTAMDMPDRFLQLRDLYALINGEPLPQSPCQIQSNRTFNAQEVKAMTTERKFSKIKQIYNDLKNKLFNRDKNRSKTKQQNRGEENDR